MEVRWMEGTQKIGVVYWSNGLTLEKADILGKDCDYLQIWYPKNIDNKIYDKYGEILNFIELNGFWKGKAYSAIIDLAESEEKIRSHFSKNRRYEVRRADEKDNLRVRFEVPDKEEDCEKFIDFYNAFAKTKGLHEHGKNKTYALVRQGMLTIASVFSESNEILAMHGYICDQSSGIVALYTSSSLFREQRESASLIGRANSLLHYKSMLYFKQKGYLLYDFGGTYRGHDNVQLQNITTYKMSFGGKFVEFDNGFTIPYGIVNCVDAFIEHYFNLFDKKKVIVWGAAASGKYLLHRLRELNIPIECVIDNKLADDNKSYVKDSVLEGYKPEEILVIVTTNSESYKKIVKQSNCIPFIQNRSIMCINENSEEI